MIVVPLVVFAGQLSGGDGDKNEGATTVIVPPTPSTFKDSKLGLEVAWPKDWRSKIERKAGRLELTSKDKTTAMLIAVTTPSTGPAAKALYRDAIVGLRQTYKGARIFLVKRPEPLSGLPTAQAEVTGMNKKGVKQKIGITVARGRKHLYLVEVIAPQKGGQLGEVAVITRTLRLTG